jgi:hypothetical protein
MRRDPVREPFGTSREVLTGTLCWATGLVTGVLGTLAYVNLHNYIG